MKKNVTKTKIIIVGIILLIICTAFTTTISGSHLKTEKKNEQVIISIKSNDQRDVHRSVSLSPDEYDNFKTTIEIIQLQLEQAKSYAETIEIYKNLVQ